MLEVITTSRPGHPATQPPSPHGPATHPCSTHERVMDDLQRALTQGTVQQMVCVVRDVLSGCASVLSPASPCCKDVGRLRFQLKSALKSLDQRPGLTGEDIAEVREQLLGALVRVEQVYRRVEVAYLTHLQRAGATDKVIRQLSFLSQSTLYRKRLSGEIPPKYFVAPSHCVDKVVREVKRKLPSGGRGLVHGALVAKGIRLSQATLRASLKRVDPIGVQARQTTVRRKRVYTNRNPDRVHHIDGNHKLCALTHGGRCTRCSLAFASSYNLWPSADFFHLVVHGGVDGATRRVLWLDCLANNRSWSVLKRGLEAAVRAGRLPLRVHSDHGTMRGAMHDLLQAGMED